MIAGRRELLGPMPADPFSPAHSGELDSFSVLYTRKAKSRGPKPRLDHKYLTNHGNLFIAPFSSSPTRTGPSFEGSLFLFSKSDFPVETR